MRRMSKQRPFAENRTKADHQRRLSAICLSLSLALFPCTLAVKAQSAGGSQETIPPTATFPSAPAAGDTVVPTGSTNVLDFSNSSSLNILGDLLNQGTIYALSTNPAITSGTISANNIYNYPGATITSILPTGGLPGYANAVSGFSFTLNAVNNIVNAGTIASAGNLNLVAGNSIVNALPAGVTGPSPVMQAASQLNIVSNLVQNSGLIASLSSNINVASQTAQNLAINNVGGTISAMGNLINISTSSVLDKLSITATGGNWISDRLNIDTTGKLFMDVNSVTGLLTCSGDSISVITQGNNLSIGAVNAYGDPLFANGLGDIEIRSNLQFSGQNLAIVAAGNIYSDSNVILDTSSSFGNGGSVTLVAGGVIPGPIVRDRYIDPSDPDSLQSSQPGVWISGANGLPASINLQAPSTHLELWGDRSISSRLAEAFLSQDPLLPPAEATLLLSAMVLLILEP